MPDREITYLGRFSKLQIERFLMEGRTLGGMVRDEGQRAPTNPSTFLLANLHKGPVGVPGRIESEGEGKRIKVGGDVETIAPCGSLGQDDGGHRTRLEARRVGVVSVSHLKRECDDNAVHELESVVGPLGAMIRVRRRLEQSQDLENT